MTVAEKMSRAESTTDDSTASDPVDTRTKVLITSSTMLTTSDSLVANRIRLAMLRLTSLTDLLSASAAAAASASTGAPSRERSPDSPEWWRVMRLSASANESTTRSCDESRLRHPPPTISTYLSVLRSKMGQ